MREVGLRSGIGVLSASLVVGSVTDCYRFSITTDGLLPTPLPTE